MSKFTQPWGWSKLATYEDCPAKFAYEYIEKRPSPANAAMERGSEMHLEAEAWLNGWIQDLPERIAIFEERYKALKEAKAMTEVLWSFDKDWQYLEGDWPKDTHLRAKLDAHYIDTDGKGVVVDFKSGKVREANEDQLRLYALCFIMTFPEVEDVVVQLWYWDSGEVKEREYSRTDLMRFKPVIQARADMLYKDENFAPRPTMNCRWCPHSRTKGGPCPY